MDLSGRFWGDARSLALPVAAYWLTTALAFATCAGTLVVLRGGRSEVLVALAIFGAATAAGIGFGQACAALRLRTWAALALGTLTATLLVLGAVALLGAGTLAAFVGLFAFLFPFFALTGWWSLSPGGAMASMFAPLVYYVAAVIAVATAGGRLSRWRSGAKWALFDVWTLPVLCLSIVGVLAFLASREAHRVHHWQNLGATTLVTSQRKAGTALGAWLRSLGTLAAFAGLALGLTLGSALLAPYLWRTGPVDGQGDAPARREESGPPPDDRTDPPRAPGDDQDPAADGHPAKNDQEAGDRPDDGQPSDGPGEASPGGGGGAQGGGGGGASGGGGAGGGGASGGGGAASDGSDPADGADGSDGSDARDPGSPAPPEAPAPAPRPAPASPMTPQEMQEAARQAGVSLLFLLLFALLALLALLVFGPPVRRTLLLTHFRRPLWPVPPTRHVRQSWWLVEIALADLGIERAPGDTAGTLARRAVSGLPDGLYVEPLLDVARVADRVAYGFGLQPDDTMRARRQAEMAYEVLWSQLTEGQKLRAMYRWV